MRVAVTGATGFLGSSLVRSYGENGHRVRAISRSAGPSAETPAWLEPVAIRLSSAAALAGQLAGHDLLIHTAVAKLARGSNDWQRVVDENVEMTTNVIDAAKRAGVRRVVHISSTAAIGIPPRGAADESFAFNLDDRGPSYALAKHLSEKAALSMSGANTEVVVVNPGFVFGRHRGAYRGGAVFDRCLDRRVVLCTDGGLSIVHIDDVTAGIQAAAQLGRAGERYILSGDNVSFRAIAESVVRLAGVRRAILTVPNQIRWAAYVASAALARLRGEVAPLTYAAAYAHPFYDSTKARAELGFAARPIADIIRDYLDARRHSVE